MNDQELIARFNEAQKSRDAALRLAEEKDAEAAHLRKEADSLEDKARQSRQAAFECKKAAETARKDAATWNDAMRQTQVTRQIISAEDAARKAQEFAEADRQKAAAERKAAADLRAEAETIIAKLKEAAAQSGQAAKPDETKPETKLDAPAA